MKIPQPNIEYAQGFRIEANEDATKEQQMNAISLLSDMAGVLSNTHAILVNEALPNDIMAANLSHAATVLNSIVAQISNIDVTE